MLANSEDIRTRTRIVPAGTGKPAGTGVPAQPYREGHLAHVISLSAGIAGIPQERLRYPTAIRKSISRFSEVS
jgi:hypothetical protein